MMLVSALAGREHVLSAYEEAVRERYRFFSFGDAMLIMSEPEERRRQILAERNPEGKDA